jgi:uncharacterized membrane protein
MSALLSIAQLLAVLACTLFTGAAIYITLVEHPARMGCDTRTAATVWAPSYKRATWMQAPLAIVSLIGALGAWLLGAGVWWLVGGVLIGSVVPFTLIVIRPTNDRLLAPDRDLTSDETRALLQRWGRLHAVRGVLSSLASLLLLLAWLRDR